jgi:hypothetical protein
MADEQTQAQKAYGAGQSHLKIAWGGFAWLPDLGGM